MAELDDALSGSRRYALEELRGKLYRDQGIDYVPGYRRGAFDDSPTAESVSREESQGHATARWLKNVEKGMEDQELIKKNEDYPRIRGPQKISMTIEHPSSSEPPAGGPREMIGQIKEGARDIRRGTQHLPWNRQDVFGGAAKIAASPFVTLADQAGLLLEAVTRGLITKDQFKTALAALRGGELPTKSGAKFEQWMDKLPTEMENHTNPLPPWVQIAKDNGAVTQSDLESFEKRLPELRRQGVTPLFDPDRPMIGQQELEDAILKAGREPPGLINRAHEIFKQNNPNWEELKGGTKEFNDAYDAAMAQARNEIAGPRPRTYEDALREQKMATEDPFQGGWPPGTEAFEEEPGITYSPSGRKLIDDRKLHENNKGGFRMKPLVSAGEQRDQTASIIENLRRPRPHVVSPGERGGMQQNPALVEQRQRLQEALPDFTSKAVKPTKDWKIQPGGDVVLQNMDDWEAFAAANREEIEREYGSTARAYQAAVQGGLTLGGHNARTLVRFEE